jgi:hypothetical protein
MESMHAMEGVETTRQGIFVMPKERITILSTFMYYVADPMDTVATAWSFQECGAPVDPNSSQKHHDLC